MNIECGGREDCEGEELLDFLGAHAVVGIVVLDCAPVLNGLNGVHMGRHLRNEWIVSRPISGR